MKRAKHSRRWVFGLCLWMILLGPVVVAQPEGDAFADDMQLLEIESRMLDFYDQLNELSARVPHAKTEAELTEVDRQATALDTKWNAYYQSNQTEIAADDSLLQIVADYQLVKQGLSDSIAGKRHLNEVRTGFAEVEAFIFAQDSAYARLYETALEYSLVKSLAPQLEKVQGREQLLFAAVQSRYEHAKNWAQEVPELQPRFPKIEEKYLELKNTSEKIQDMKFKPWIQRIKDYLYSIAAVAMILMFVNVLQAKLKTLKQARENAKKLRQMMNKEEDDYPTI